ncbi:unnamed protein product [Paramecium octaurelia]|uniref:Uncharacterized protein n=1 Tax=Paramecium octaurelia TaxID=43137 RepID=A0A8S1SWI0_PAROT|nr:unnamed protein product [Paramecium octaurelia]
MFFNNSEQNFQGNTPLGYQFGGAYTFGTSERTDWVKRDDKVQSKTEQAAMCERFEETLRITEKLRQSQQKSTRSNFPRDDRIKPIKSTNPPVGQYNLHKQLILDEENIKNISDKTQQEKKKAQFTIQTSLGKIKPNGEIDTHPTWVNGKEQQFREDPIGPGSYNPNIPGKTQAPISFGYKETFNWTKDGPSPDKYYNSETFSQFRTTTSWQDTKHRKTGFGSAPKNVWPKSIDLGPGQYQPNELPKGLTISFPKSERQYYKSSDIPGPGAYAPKNVNVKKAFSIGHKYIPFKTSDFYVPGPGTYNQKLPSNGKYISMPKDKRQDLVTRESTLKPGPGQYIQSTDTIKPKEVPIENQHGFGVAKRYELAEEENIELPEKTEQQKQEEREKIGFSTLGGPKYSMRQKNEKQSINQNPSPGKYEPDYDYKYGQQSEYKPPYHYTVPKTATPSMGFSNRSDPTISKFKEIGPGSYTALPSQSGPRISMPKAARFPIREPEDVGPGSYKIGTTIGLIPKYHFEKQRDQLETSLTQFDKFHK